MEDKKPKDELLDLVNEQDEVIGTVWRSLAHKDSTIIHREVAIAVFNDQGEVLLQQRSLNKTSAPGKWKITAAGHVGGGENPQSCMKREVLEELGLEVEPIFFCKVFEQKEFVEARFSWIYYAKLKASPKPVLDENEVMAADWVKVAELEEFSKTHDYRLEDHSHRMIVEIYNKIISLIYLGQSDKGGAQ